LAGINTHPSERLTRCTICRASGRDVPAVEDGYCERHLAELNEAAKEVSRARSRPSQDSASQAGLSTQVGQGNKGTRKRQAIKGINRSYRDSNTEDPNRADSVEKELAEVDRLWALYETGELVPERIELRPLPDADAYGALRAIYDDYGITLSLRVDAEIRDENGDPCAYDVLYSVRWVAERVNRPRETVHRALKRLVELGILEEPKALSGRGGLPGTHTYAPVPVRHLTALTDPKSDEKTERRAA